MRCEIIGMRIEAERIVHQLADPQAPLSGRPTMMARSASRSDSEKLRGTGTSCSCNPGYSVRNRVSRGAMKALPNPSGAPMRIVPATSSCPPICAAPVSTSASMRSAVLSNLRAIFGQDRAARGPVKQARAQIGLKRCDMPAEPRLAHAKARGRAQHLTLARDSQEIAQVVPVHFDTSFSA